MTQIYPVLPLRDIVVFPHFVVPLFVGREKSVCAIEAVMKEDKQILLLAQREASQDDPQKEDLYEIGTLSSILQLLKLPDGPIKILVEGSRRARIKRYIDNADYLEAEIEFLSDVVEKETEIQALAQTIISQFEQYVKLDKKTTPEAISSIEEIDDPAKLADIIAGHLSIKNREKQQLLEENDLRKRLERIFEFIENKIGVLQVEKKLRYTVKRQMEKTQREYYLNEQMKAIQKELGGSDEAGNEYDELEKKIARIKLSKEARQKATAELKKMRQMSPLSAESTVVRNYLDWLLSIPWGRKARLNTDIDHAKKILDEDHFGLEKVKERILESLAVQARKKSMRSPIICLVGPPGVGKTSLGRSVARATGRDFVRVSLGGVRDEAEIRGHRRTYIGSMPGRIIQSMRKAKRINPLFLLDEIDKVGSDFRGDPSAALLEVLDPEQNNSFNDHYLEVDYDLSNVMFLTTVNTLNIPPPLLDRMELIRIPGYMEDEKIQIARRHIIPKQMKEHALSKQEWSISDSGLHKLIRNYTREAGVRNLEREIANLCRKAVKALAFEKEKIFRIGPRQLPLYAGISRYQSSEAEGEDQIGVTNGLAWTEAGGVLLQVEAISLPGKGKMKTTGKLGEVMKESIEAASSVVRDRAIGFGIRPDLFEKRDIHIHVPEGATPKDGPSAGIAMVTSIISTLTGIKVRRDVAMTGEITLRGRVLAIGGLKEKLLAATLAGIKTVIVPQDNKKDLAEVPVNVKRKLSIIPVKMIDEALKCALSEPLHAIEWVEDGLSSPSERQVEDKQGVVTH